MSESIGLFITGYRHINFVSSGQAHRYAYFNDEHIFSSIYQYFFRFRRISETFNNFENMINLTTFQTTFPVKLFSEDK